MDWVMALLLSGQYEPTAGNNLHCDVTGTSTGYDILLMTQAPWSDHCMMALL
jgi:hypothetical protein